MLFTTRWIFLDFQDNGAYLLLLLFKKMTNPPCDAAFLKLANAALLKHNILHCPIFPRIGNCYETFSDFSLQMYLFAFARSLILASATDTLTSHAPKLLSGLVWLYVEFSCPARSLNFWASSAFTTLSLEIFLSLQIWTSINSWIYICWSKYIQSCFCSIC